MRIKELGEAVGSVQALRRGCRGKMCGADDELAMAMAAK